MKKEEKTLPDAGGPLDPFGPDRLLSYPQTFSFDQLVKSDIKKLFSAADLPGTLDIPPHSPGFVDQENAVNRVPSVSQTKLPSGGAVPRADYYDATVISTTGDEWADEDSGAYACEGDDSSANLPGVLKNEMNFDNSLGALGNSWSGTGIEDVSGPQGFPSQDFSENVDYGKSDNQDGGRVLASLSFERLDMANIRKATNIDLVRTLTSSFIKKEGKKDLTRRHIMAFLQTEKQPQYLASDIVRCLLLDHNIYVKDVLDEFPVAKIASSGPSDGVQSLASIRSKLIDMEIRSFGTPEISSSYRTAAAAITRAIAALERIENG